MALNGEIRCSQCGARMLHTTRPAVCVYRGKRRQYELPGFYCTKCDNSHITSKDAAAADRELSAFRARVDTDLLPLLPPSKIRGVRKSLNLSQKVAGKIFGGGPMAFSKYERGEYKQPLSTDILLRLLASSRIKLTDIERLAGPRASPSKRPANRVTRPDRRKR